MDEDVKKELLPQFEAANGYHEQQQLLSQVRYTGFLVRVTLTGATVVTPEVIKQVKKALGIEEEN